MARSVPARVLRALAIGGEAVAGNVGGLGREMKRVEILIEAQRVTIELGPRLELVVRVDLVRVLALGRPVGGLPPQVGAEDVPAPTIVDVGLVTQHLA